KTLTKLCQEILIERLIKTIFLWVENSNNVAIRLYKKLGFVEDSTIFATYCDRRTNKNIEKKED
ncbi:MAG: GNAT family N-acetyltransferase, partial [Candidatus Hodarchaeales archaeon]